MLKKLKKFYYFHLANPVMAKGESESRGFRYVFRRFWLEISTLSGNWSMRVTASEHPYAFLQASVQNGLEANIYGFAELLYYLNATMTRDEGLVNDVRRALSKYETRLQKEKAEAEDNEEASLEEVKKIQAYVDATPQERRKIDRRINRKFNKVAWNLQGIKEKE